MRRTSPNARRRAGFTLVELLTVIAIIGILAAILIPTIGNVLQNAQVAVARSNLGSIAKSYLSYSTSGGRTRVINEQTIYEYARILAQYSDLNDPRVWLLAEDPLVAEQGESNFPTVVAKPASQGQPWQTDPDFTRFPISFAVASKLSPRAPGSTPLAWLRGLKSTGHWSGEDEANPSPFGANVGLISFKDGHVEEYNDGLDVDGGLLTHYTSRDRTSDVKNALSPRAEILESSK